MSDKSDTKPSGVKAWADLWRLKIDSMGNDSGTYYKFVYRSVGAATEAAADLDEEWTSYKPEKSNAELISEDRAIIDGRVYIVSNATEEEMIRERAKKKLTKREREVLGL